MFVSKETIQTISLEAPGDFLSGLLGIQSAQLISLRTDSILTLPPLPGTWQLLSPADCRLHVAFSDHSWPLAHSQAAAFSGSEELTLLPYEDGTLYRLVLSGSIAVAVLLECSKSGGLFFPRGGDALERMIHLLSGHTRRQTSAREASQMAYQLLMTLMGTGSETPENRRNLPLVVEAALGIIRRDYAFLDGISELALRLEVSQEYLTRCFFKYTGVTPGKYLNQVRIENAKLLLQHGRHKIQFVSDACGFSNANYFAKVFRDSVGISPREYARLQKAKEEAKLADVPQQEDRLYVL